MRSFRFAALILLSALCATPAAAQNYPSRPIHIIVPFPAGGPSDVLARLISDKMSVDFQQAVVVENRPGANTVIGAEAAAKASPDGYTLLMAINSTLVMNQYLYKIAALRSDRRFCADLAGGEDRWPPRGQCAERL